MYNRRPRVRLELKSPTLASPLGRLLLAGLLLTWIWGSLVLVAASRPIFTAQVADATAAGGSGLVLTNQSVLPVLIEAVGPVSVPFTPETAATAWIGAGRRVTVPIASVQSPAGTQAVAAPGTAVPPVPQACVMVRINILGVRVLQVIPVSTGTAPASPR